MRSTGDITTGSTGIVTTRSTGNVTTRSAGNGVKNIPGHWFMGISTGITAGHCVCLFQATRRGWGWIMDPV